MLLIQFERSIHYLFSRLSFTNLPILFFPSPWLSRPAVSYCTYFHVVPYISPSFLQHKVENQIDILLKAWLIIQDFFLLSRPPVCGDIMIQQTSSAGASMRNHL